MEKADQLIHIRIADMNELVKILRLIELRKKSARR